MQLDGTAKAGTYKVWLTDDELEQLRRAAVSHRDDLIIQLGGYVGLRAFEVPQIKPEHIKRTADGEHYHLRVPEGKDTKNGNGEPRDAYLPKDVERDLHRFQNAEDIAPIDSFIQLAPKGACGLL